MPSKNDPEVVRRLRVRQLFNARLEQERTVTGVVNFYGWLKDHYPGLIRRGSGDVYQRIRTDVFDLILKLKPEPK